MILLIRLQEKFDIDHSWMVVELCCLCVFSVELVVMQISSSQESGKGLENILASPGFLSQPSLRVQYQFILVLCDTTILVQPS